MYLFEDNRRILSCFLLENLSLHFPSICHKFVAFIFDQSWGRFHKLFCALCPTFEKLFKGVGCTLCHAPNFKRAISMICTFAHNFYEIDPGLSSTLVEGRNLTGTEHSTFLIRHPTLSLLFAGQKKLLN